MNRKIKDTFRFRSTLAMYFKFRAMTRKNYVNALNNDEGHANPSDLKRSPLVHKQ